MGHSDIAVTDEYLSILESAFRPPKRLSKFRATAELDTMQRRCSAGPPVTVIHSSSVLTAVTTARRWHVSPI
jgi:hypothetical protein